MLGNIQKQQYAVQQASCGRAAWCGRRAGLQLPHARQAEALPTCVTKATSAAGAPAVDVAKALSKLQNGSDIRGVAVATAEQSVTLTPAAAYFIGRGFADWMTSKGLKNLKVSIGQDPRITGPLLKSSVAAGLLDAGVTVVDVELSTTPAMFYSLVAPGSSFTGAIMLTASHMPYQNNGLKFFARDGGLGKADIKHILEVAARECQQHGVQLGRPETDHAYVLQRALAVDGSSIHREPLLRDYAASLRQVIIEGANHPQHRDQPLRGFKIAVDAGNGSGGFFATQVLQPLGADVAGSQFLEPDGMFPNHIPNPENAAAMAAATSAVVESGADLGIVFDTDVDRAAIVESTGQPINSNRMIALMSAITLREHPGTTIVTDSVTSNGLTDFIRSLGGKHFRYQRGYKNVIGKGIELNRAGEDCQLMIETSGHGALAENNFLDDGAYLAVKAIIEMVRRRLEGKGDLGDLLSKLKSPLEAQEYRLKISDPEFREVGAKVLERFHAWVTAGADGATSWRLEEVNHEGWRVDVDEGGGARGWLLLRQSLHDPLLVLNIESDVPGGLQAIKAKFQGWVQQQRDLPVDTSAFFPARDTSA